MALGIEYAIVVNKTDEIIEFKNRDELSYDDMVRIVVVWLENDEGLALVHKRSSTKKHGANRWENAAGGGVVKGQSYEEAAYSELSEEIGVEDVKLVFISKNIVHTDSGDRMCSWFKGICNKNVDEFKLEKENVVEVKWVDKKELFEDRDKHPDKYMPSSFYWRELFDN